MNKPKNYPFVEPEIARLAKQKGFKENCYAIYDERNMLGNSHPMYVFDEKDTWNTLAPLYQQLIDWFREIHEVRIVIDEDFDNMLGYLRGWIPKVNGENSYQDNDCFDNYYNALQEAIKKAFKLI